MLYEYPTFTTIKDALNSFKLIISALVAMGSNTTMSGYRKTKARRRLNGYCQRFAEECGVEARLCAKGSKDQKEWIAMAERMTAETAKIKELRETLKESIEWV